MDTKLFLGIDPGAGGGCGLVTVTGEYETSYRWPRKDPAVMYYLLKSYGDRLVAAYIEVVGLFPGAGIAMATAMQSLLINAGIWRGWLMALDIPWGEIHPNSWQSQVGLFRWQKKLAADPSALTPLKLARDLYPDADLRFQADDGKAVGLILAGLARSHLNMGSFTPANDSAVRGEAIAPQSMSLSQQKRIKAQLGTSVS